MVFNLIYSDGKTGKSFVKRFTIPAIIRDKEYDLTQGNPNSRVHYLSANPNGEAEVVIVKLTAASSARKKIFEFDFSELEIKGRGSRGNTLTKYPIRKVELLQSGVSTLSGLDLWFDPVSGRLNKDKRGKHVGKFDGDDQILSITKSGNYKLTGFELNTRFDGEEKTLLVEKFNPKKVITAVYWDGESKQHFVKRFQIETNTVDKDFGFISEGIGSRLEFASTADSPEIIAELVKGKSKTKELETIHLEEIVDVKGWKALGNRLSPHKVTKLKPVEESGGGADEESQEDASESKGVKSTRSQSQKKKSENPEPQNGQPQKESRQKSQPQEKSQSQNQGQSKSQNPGQDQSQSQKAGQASLFEESQPQKENQKEEVKAKSDKKSGQGTAFGIGDTIELEL